MVLRPRRPGDPFVAKWVMERIKFAREIGDQGQADELEALFDETTLRQIIETDRWDLVFDVFTSFKTSLFIPVQGYMLDNWHSWKGARARLSAVRIAELAPPDTDYVVLALRRDGRWEFNPGAELRAKPGSTLIVMTTPAGRAKLERLVAA